MQAERVAHVFSFLLNSNLRGHSELRGDDVIFLYEPCHNSTRQEIEVPQAERTQGQKNRGESQCSCLMVHLTCP